MDRRHYTKFLSGFGIPVHGLKPVVRWISSRFHRKVATTALVSAILSLAFSFTAPALVVFAQAAGPGGVS